MLSYAVTAGFCFPRFHLPNDTFFVFMPLRMEPLCNTRFFIYIEKTPGCGGTLREAFWNQSLTNWQNTGHEERLAVSSTTRTILKRKGPAHPTMAGPRLPVTGLFSMKAEASNRQNSKAGRYFLVGSPYREGVESSRSPSTVPSAKMTLLVRPTFTPLLAW
jgi:hypothetical protein